MASVDIASGLAGAVSINYAQLTASKTGDTIVDMQGYEGGVLAVYIDTLTTVDADNYVTFKITAGDNSALSDGAALSSGDYIGTVPVLNGDSTADTLVMCGFLTDKRYVRIDTTETGTTDVTVAAFIVKGAPRHGATD